MNSSYNTPTLLTNTDHDEKSGDSSTSLSSVHDVASADGTETVLGSLTSRVFLQVLSARALGTQVDGISVTAAYDLRSQGENEMYGNDDVPSPLSSSTATVTASLAPSLSISSIARAEQMLQKSVPLVNGGRHVALTKEDVSRIRDGELLRFLEANSTMFVKYLQRRGDSAPVAETIETSAVGDADVEQEIESLANRIETFITAVDDEGQQYHICVDDEGNLLVPVALGDILDAATYSGAAGIIDYDDKAEVGEYDVGETDPHEENVVAEDLVESRITPLNAVTVEDEKDEDSVTAKKEDTSAVGASRVSRITGMMKRHTPLGGRHRFGRPVHVSASPTALAKAVPLSATPSLSLSSLSQEKQENGTTGKKQKKTGRATINTPARREAPLSTARAPLVPVRGVGLTAEQDHRVEELMHTDFSTQPSPYAGLSDRLAEVEERLRWFQEVRGPLCMADNYENDDDDIYACGREEVNEGNSCRGDDGSMEVADDAALINSDNHHVKQGQEERQQSRAKVLGDAYMREVRERRLRGARLRSINARLAQLHYVQQLDPLRPAVDAEKIARVPRPSWLHDVPPSPRAYDITALVEDARRENALAVTRGEKLPQPVGDRRIAYLQEKLRVARERVESLGELMNCGSSSSPSSTPHVSY